MFNIALYQPDIPQNTAAIIRLCSCFDTTLEIIEPCGFHLDDKRLKRVAMDYIDKSKIITYKSYEDFLDDGTDAVYFDDHDDLSDYIKYYSKNDSLRSKIAFNGKEKYFKIFENTLVTKYMVEKILDYKISNKLSWMK